MAEGKVLPWQTYFSFRLKQPEIYFKHREMRKPSYIIPSIDFWHLHANLCITCNKNIGRINHEWQEFSWGNDYPCLQVKNAPSESKLGLRSFSLLFFVKREVVKKTLGGLWRHFNRKLSELPTCKFSMSHCRQTSIKDERIGALPIFFSHSLFSGVFLNHGAFI